MLKLLTGIGLPLLTAVAWGMFIAPKAVVRVPVWLWLLLQAAIFVAAGYALYASRRPMLAGAFLLVVVLNSVLLSMWRDKGVSKATLGM